MASVLVMILPARPVLDSDGASRLWLHTYGQTSSMALEFVGSNDRMSGLDRMHSPPNCVRASVKFIIGLLIAVQREWVVSAGNGIVTESSNHRGCGKAETACDRAGAHPRQA